MKNITARYPIGVVNANGHLYTKECMEKALAEVQGKIASRQLLARAEPDGAVEWGGPQISFFRAVGIVTGATLEDSEVVLEIEPLPGRGLHADLDFRQAGTGTLDAEGVIQDFSLEYILVCQKGHGA